MIQMLRQLFYNDKIRLYSTNVENSIYTISFYTVLFCISGSMYAGVLRNTDYSTPV